jgi:tetratricopeptide (TPR) repeat protein
MHNELRAQIHDNLIGKSTDDLLEIWQNGDPEEWDEVTFEIIGEILRDRREDLPPRSAKLQVKGLLEETEAHLDVEEWEAVLKVCQQIIRVDPRVALAHYYRGIAFDELEQLEPARVSFLAALELDPKLKAARERLGYVEQDLLAETPVPEVSQELVQAKLLVDQGKGYQA